MMNNKHRKILSEMSGICNDLGADLDGTSTHESKYKDRQKAHTLVYKVLYGVLCDVPANDERERDMEMAEKALEDLRVLQKKNYPDRKGLHSFTAD